jgi:hypothetical protein
MSVIIGTHSGSARRLLRTGVNGQPLRAGARWERFEFHNHHQVIQFVPAPASQPRHVPVAEAQSQHDRCAEAQKLSFSPEKIADYISSNFRKGNDDGLVLVARYLGSNE